MSLIRFFVCAFFIPLFMVDIAPAKTLNVITQKAEALAGPAKKHAKTFEEKHNVKVVIHEVPFGELFDEIRNGMQGPNPKYDIAIMPPAWLGDIVTDIDKLPQNIIQEKGFEDVHPAIKDANTTFEGEYYALPLDGDLFMGYYRKDLLENPKHQEAFKEKYNRDLQVPETWAEYRDIAEYFHLKKDEDGNTIYGAAEAFKRGTQQFWNLFARAAAYTNPPEVDGLQFFYPDQTFEAQINNPGWRRAAEEYLEILKFTPPDGKNFGIVDVRKAFMDGKVALALDWADLGLLATDKSKSKIHDKVGFFGLPGTKKYWDARTEKWVYQSRPNRPSFLAFGGWIGAVSKHSSHKESAWQYITHYGSVENSGKDVLDPASGVNPYRLSHFAMVDQWAKRLGDFGLAVDYINVIREAYEHPVSDLRIVGFHDYTSALETEMERVINNKISISKALYNVAEAWEKITDRLDRKKQLERYLSVFNLDAKDFPKRQPKLKAPIKTKKKDKISVGFSQTTTTEPWRIQFNYELRTEAVKHNFINLFVKDAQDNHEQQIRDIEKLIAEGVDYLLISPKVAHGYESVLKKAKEKGIFIIILDRDLNDKVYDQFIGGDNHLIGKTAGNYVADLLKKHSQGALNIIEIWGGHKSTPAIDRHKGFFEVIDQTPGLKLLNRDNSFDQKDADWKQNNAYEIMQQSLNQHEKIDVVYAHNDPMAYGAYLAAKDLDRAEKIRFIGIDGLPKEGKLWVESGILDATFVYTTPGAEAIRQVVQHFKGQPLKERITLPTKIITKKQ